MHACDRFLLATMRTGEILWQDCNSGRPRTTAWQRTYARLQTGSAAGALRFF